MKYLLLVCLWSAVCADQPFEPIFATGGVPVLAPDANEPTLMQLRSGEHFVRFVGRASQPVVVKLDKQGRTGCAEQTRLLAELVAQWPVPLRGYTVDAGESIELARAIVRAVGASQVVLPSYFVFLGGKGVTPVLAGAQTAESLSAAVASRLAHAQQAVASGAGSRWWDAMCAWVNSFASFVTWCNKRIWTTLVGGASA